MDNVDKYVKIQKRYTEHKQVVLKWEGAFSKTEGRQPGKSDLEQAPRNVRLAYQSYHKYKKVLAKRAEAERRYREQQKRNGLSTTPQKIFNRGAAKSSHGSSSRHESKKIPVEKKPKLKSSSNFASSLAQKLFSIQKSGISCKSNKKSEESCDSSANCAEDSLNISGVSGGGDEARSSVQERPIEVSDSFESIDINDSQFDSAEDDNFPLSDTLYTNFAAELTDNSSTPSFLNDEMSHFSMSSSSNQTLSDYSGPISEAGPSAPPQDIDSVIAEDVRNCFSTMNSMSEESYLNDDTFFPEASFILGPTLSSAKAPEQQQQKDKIVEQEPDEEFPTLTLLQPAKVNCLKVGKENVESPAKRKYSFAMSPSPQKEPKRKIFKSDRKSTRKISLDSCRPNFQTTPTVSKSKASVRPSTPIASDDSNPVAGTSYDLSSDSDHLTPPSTRASGKKDKSISSSKPKAKTSTVGKRSTRTTSKTIEAPKPTDVTNDEEIPQVSSSLIPVVDAFDIVAEKQSKKDMKVARRVQAKAARLKKKGVNDNYVSIDIKKKVFVRKKKTINSAKIKRLEWKQKKSLASRETRLKSLTCLKCGDIGHYARFCPKAKNITEETSTGNEVVDDSPWPTLEEAARMVQSKGVAGKNQTVVYGTVPEALEDDNATPDATQSGSLGTESQSSAATLTQGSTFFTLVNLNAKTTEPYVCEDSGIDSDGPLDDDVYQALRVFGYENFRSGQKEAVLRVLRGESTLLMLSTGSGKSLCYQLPAYLYAKKYPGTMTVCVSPLVSLMEDQVQSMPAFISAVCLHYNMTDKKKADAIERIKKKQVQILLVSPEALCGGLFGLFRDIDNMPPIGFACIDEVHCVSEWSHNFRPSYLQVCKILREKLNIKTILGLTATATAQTCVGICEQLQIHPSTIIRGEVVPKNLKLSVSRDTQRDEALVRLLYSDRFRECESIIIYCTRREECNRISELIRTHIRSDTKFSSITKSNGRSRVSNNCEAYHAGLTAARRSTIQKEFMQGRIRIVVATIAFGMGIDKSDIRAVIHYNMPSTFESYVQEIGRAGRDGLEAHCHLFLDNVKGRDIAELKRHIFANFVDRVTVRKLIGKIFKACVCKNIEKLSLGNRSQAATSGRCQGHEVSFSVKEAIEDLDLPEENIETLLCHLEVDKGRKWIEMLPKTYEMCKIHSYGGTQLLKSSALKCPPLAVAIALEKEKKRFKDGDTYLEFNVIEAAAAVGWNSAVVRKELKSLEWTGSEFNSHGKPTKFRKSGIIVEFSDLAFRVKAPGDLSDKEFDDVLNSLCGFITTHERRELYQLHKVYQALLSISASSVEEVCDVINEEASTALKNFIHEYFQSDVTDIPATWKAVTVGAEREQEIRREVGSLLMNYRDTKFTGRAVARIFQGIHSPNFPAQDWFRNRAFWRRFMDVDFHVISKIASEEIIANS